MCYCADKGHQLYAHNKAATRHQDFINRLVYSTDNNYNAESNGKTSCYYTGADNPL